MMCERSKDLSTDRDDYGFRRRKCSGAVIDGVNEFTTPLQLHYIYVTFWTNLDDSMNAEV
jgi:hypothetical protein